MQAVHTLSTEGCATIIEPRHKPETDKAARVTQIKRRAHLKQLTVGFSVSPRFTALGGYWDIY